MFGRSLTFLPLALLVTLAPACGDDDDTTGSEETTGDAADTTDSGGDTGQTDTAGTPSTYAFESRFAPGASSVDYAGQTFRHLLIAELGNELSRLTARIDDGSYFPKAGDVAAALNFYFLFDSQTAGTTPLTVTTRLPLLQATYDDVSSGKFLKEKLAGNDKATDYVDWSTGFKGWTGDGVTSPESLVTALFAKVDALAVDRANGTIPNGPTGEPIKSATVTPEGYDLRELLTKLLAGGIAYHQAADDYLDDATAGKGLLADNTKAEEGKPYTALEHAWDEGFGYLGAAINMGDFTGDELDGTGGRADFQKVHDLNGDGKIDLKTEFNFSSATYIGRREAGAAKLGVTLPLIDDTFGAFVRGRAIITAAGGALSDAQLSALKAERDRALAAWELALVGNIIRYANDTLQALAKAGTPDYAFETHAKYWSELKAFALFLQFNPRAKISPAQLDQLHARIGQAPVLPNAGEANLTKARADLVAAKDLLAQVYALDARLVGSADGTNGW
jgi:hypothetical protein